MRDRKVSVVFLPCHSLGGEGPVAFQHLATHQLRLYIESVDALRDRVRTEILYWTPDDLQKDRSGYAVITMMRRLRAQAPDVVAFGLYSWTIEPCRNLASVLKETYPGLLVVCGGPEVSDRRAFVDEFSAFDVVVEGEGELPLRRVLERLSSGVEDLSGIPNLSFRRPDGTFEHGEPVSEHEDRARVPSPFLDIPCDPEAGAGSAYFTSSIGCSRRCTYCLYSCQAFRTKEPGQVVRELEQIVSRPDVSYVSFTDYDVFDVLRHDPATFHEIARVLRQGRQQAVLAMIGPNALADPAFLDVLKVVPGLQIQMGLQSLNPDTLKAVQRGWSIPGIRLLERIPAELKGIISVQLMLPLPLETPASFYAGLEHLVALGFYRLMIFPVMVLRGSRLRARAADWGVRFLGASPYYCHATATFTTEDWFEASAVAHVFYELNEVTTSEQYGRLSELFRRHPRMVREIRARVQSDHPVQDIVADLIREAGLEVRSPVTDALPPAESPPTRDVPGGDTAPAELRDAFPASHLLEALVVQRGHEWVNEVMEEGRLDVHLKQRGQEVILQLRQASDDAPFYCAARHLKISYRGALSDFGLLEDLAALIEGRFESA